MEAECTRMLGKLSQNKHISLMKLNEDISETIKEKLEWQGSVLCKYELSLGCVFLKSAKKTICDH